MNRRLGIGLLLWFWTAGCANETAAPVVDLTVGPRGIPTTVQQLLEKYVTAWQSRDVLALVALGPAGVPVFDDLLSSDRIDRVQQTLVTLREIQTSQDPSDPEVIVVRFVKDQEDVFWAGTVTRGSARIEMRLRAVEGGLQIISHRLANATAAGNDTYLPGDARTWGEEHPPAERALHLGIRLLQDGDPTAALAKFNEALAAIAGPDGGGVHYRTGNFRFVAQTHYYAALSALRLANAEQTQQLLDRALAAYPDFAAALVLQGDLAAQKPDIDGALAAWRRSLQLDASQDELRQRIEFFDLARSFFPDPEQRTAFLSLLGMSADKAIRTLQRMLREDPSNPELHRRLAVVYLQNYQPERAEKILQESDYLHPHDLETSYLLGRSYLALKRYDDALAMFERVWQRKPGYRDTLVFLSEINALLRRYQNAIVYLQDGLHQFPKSAEIHFKIGKYLQKLGRAPEAQRYLHRAAELKPTAAIRPALLEALASS